MNTDGKKKGNWLQCQECGTVYLFPHKIQVEEIFIKANCPMCGMTTGLNLGDKEEDVYLYMNENLDNRFFNY